MLILMRQKTEDLNFAATSIYYKMSKDTYLISKNIIYQRAKIGENHEVRL